MSEDAGVQWFVECRGDLMSNESLAVALAEIGIDADEVRHPGMLGNDGRHHDVWQVPSDFVKKLRAAKRGDKRFQFRFWKRNGSEGKIYPADFIEKRWRVKKIHAVRQTIVKKRVATAAARNKLA